VKYLLDTNACIRLMTGRAPGLVERFRQHRPSEIAVCSVVKAELFYGAAKSSSPEKTLAKQKEFLSLFHSFLFDDCAAERSGHLRAELHAQGTPIGPYDTQIAAIALANDLVLVTHNVAEFERVNGLQIEDWEVSERE